MNYPKQRNRYKKRHRCTQINEVQQRRLYPIEIPSPLTQEEAEEYRQTNKESKARHDEFMLKGKGDPTDIHHLGCMNLVAREISYWHRYRTGEPTYDIRFEYGVCQDEEMLINEIRKKGYHVTYKNVDSLTHDYKTKFILAVSNPVKEIEEVVIHPVAPKKIKTKKDSNSFLKWFNNRYSQ